MQESITPYYLSWIISIDCCCYKCCTILSRCRSKERSFSCERTYTSTVFFNLFEFLLVYFLLSVFADLTEKLPFITSLKENFYRSRFLFYFATSTRDKRVYRRELRLRASNNAQIITEIVVYWTQSVTVHQFGVNTISAAFPDKQTCKNNTRKQPLQNRAVTIPAQWKYGQ